MEVFQSIDFIVKAESDLCPYLVLITVFLISASAFTGERVCLGKALHVVQFIDIALDSFRIHEGEFLAWLCILKNEFDSAVDDGLALDDLLKCLKGDDDLRKYLSIRLPALDRTCALEPVRLLHKLSYRNTLLKAHLIFGVVSEYGYLEEFGCILRSARAKTVKTQWEFIVTWGIVVILTARIKLAVYEFPVVSSLFGIVIHRDTAAEVFDLNGTVCKSRDDDLIAVTFPGLVDRVRKDLEERVNASFKIVWTENNSRTKSYSIFALEHRNTLVAVIFLTRHIVPNSLK